MRSYSQAGQDLFALDKVRGPTTFLDIGASQPIFHNNCYLLELRGWEGMSVDKDPSHFEDHLRLRSSNYLIEDALTFDWSEVLTSSVGFLSLDCDDDTCAVLKGLPTTTRFKAMCIEHDSYRLGNGPRAKMREYLRGLGYVLAYMDVRCDGVPFEDWWIDPT